MEYRGYSICSKKDRSGNLSQYMHVKYFSRHTKPNQELWVIFQFEGLLAGHKKSRFLNIHLR